jgi:hypothetical protein
MKLTRELLFFAAAAGLAAAAVPDCAMVSGWKQQGPSRSYVADNLFEYMDGNAEGYLIYGFQKMNGVTCQDAAEDSILIDVSEMADPDLAYGMFSANRDVTKAPEPIGMGGQLVPRRAIFAKDKYYVELAANPDKDHTPALRAFVAALEKAISGRTTLPDALSWFPKEKLVSVRLVPESVLGLRLLKRGYVAQYETGKAFLIKEDSPDAAAAVMEKVKARIGGTTPAKIAEDGFQAADKYLGRLAFFRKGVYIGGYANFPENQDPVAPSAALASRIP